MGGAWEREPPEKLVARLLGRLQRHALWDSALLFFPPLSAFSLLFVLLYRAALMEPGTLAFAGFALLAISFLALGLRLRGRTPRAPHAARLIDDRAEAQDRFLTLVTLDPSFPFPLVATLRREAVGLGDRIDLERDFPYRVKRPFLASLAGSLLAIVSLHLLFPDPASLTAKTAPEEELARSAGRLSQFGDHAGLARKIAAALRRKDLSAREKRSTIQGLREEVEKRLSSLEPEEKDARDLLSNMAVRLRQLESALAFPFDLPRFFPSLPWLQGAGDGDGKERPGESGPGEEKTARRGLSGEAKPQGVGVGRGVPGRGEESGGDRRRSGKGEAGTKGDRRESKDGGVEGPGGQHPGDENSPMKAPRERFLGPGEKGQEGLGRKQPPFVTVELPEQEPRAGDAQKAAGFGSGSGRERRPLPKVPLGNVPLRPRDLPDAAAEKQPLPLEYRDLIR